MDIKIGEQPNIGISLKSSPKIDIKFEAKYLRGGNFVSSTEIKNIEPMTELQYNALVQSGNVREDTFYIIYDK